MSSSNFHRLVAFLVNICTYVLKELLIECAKNDQCNPGYTDLSTYMLDAKIKNAIHTLNAVRRDQVKKLYPSPGVFDESAFDVSLLVNLLLEFHKNTLINGQAVIQGDVKKALIKIRNDRNELLHKDKTTNIDDQEFTDMWKSLKLSSMTLAKAARGSKFEDEIEKKIHNSMVNCLPGLPDILTDWFMNIISDLRSELQDIKSVSTDTYENTVTIKERTEEIPKMMGMMRTWFGNMRLMTNNGLWECRRCFTRGYSSVKLSLIKTAKVLQGNGDTEIQSYSSLEFLPNDPDGRIAAVDYRNNKLVILGRDLQPIGKPYMFKKIISSLTFISKNSLITNAVNGLYIFKVCKSSDVKLLNKKLRHNGFWPFISAMSPDTVAAVNINADPPIAMMTLTKNTVNRVDFPDLQYAEQKYDKNIGFLTFVKETDSVAFTNCKNSTVHMYNRRDKTTIRIKDERIVGLRGVCEGPGGSVFVCSTQCIVHISPTGYVIDSHKIDIDCPDRVAFSSADSSLVVFGETADNARSISLYKIE